VCVGVSSRVLFAAASCSWLMSRSKPSWCRALAEHLSGASSCRVWFVMPGLEPCLCRGLAMGGLSGGCACCHMAAHIRAQAQSCDEAFEPPDHTRCVPGERAMQRALTRTRAPFGRGFCGPCLSPADCCASAKVQTRPKHCRRVVNSAMWSSPDECRIKRHGSHYHCPVEVCARGAALVQLRKRQSVVSVFVMMSAPCPGPPSSVSPFCRCQLGRLLSRCTADERQGPFPDRCEPRQRGTPWCVDRQCGIGDLHGVDG
jgi:hypothetical protein